MTTSIQINAVAAVMGGAARYLVAFLHALAEVRPEWAVVVYVTEGTQYQLPAHFEVRPVKMNYAQRVVWDGFLLGPKAAREGAAALVNLTNYGPFRPTLPSLLFQHNPVYWDRTWVRTLGPRQRGEAWLRRQITFRQMRAASVVVTPSHAMVSYLRSWRSYSDGVRIKVIPHGVDADRFSFRPHVPEGIGNRPLRIVTVSHGLRHKGQELLIDLVDELDRRGRAAEVRAPITEADSPAYVRELVAHAARAGVADRVHFVGRTLDVERLYHEADIFVFPSLTESFGFPVLEAMACGVPVIASAIPSTLELLGDTGWMFSPGDVGDAADQVVACLATDPAEHRARLERARARALTFDWTENARQMASLIEEIAGLA